MSDRPKRIVIFDTNVLLADPQALLSFPDAEVVVPETVLGELDKLKTSRVDPDLRFRGREVSRTMFELSDQGSLVGGVDLPDGGRLRVAPFDSSTPLPEGLGARNADDRILATVWQIVQDAKGSKVTLITNDLNMLLKAQTLGIPVERHGEGVEGGWTRRYLVRPFQRYKIPLGILAIAVAVFAAVLIIQFANSPNRAINAAQLPAEFKSLLTPEQQTALDALTTLQQNQRDPEALLKMANFYFNQREQSAQANPTAALAFANQGIRYYERYLATSPSDLNARADYATLLFYAGQTDRAIQQVGQVLKADPNNVNGNYNLAIFYWQGPRRDFAQAAAQFEKVARLTKNDPNQHAVYQRVVVLQDQLKKDAAAAGRPLKETTSGAIQ